MFNVTCRVFFSFLVCVCVLNRLFKEAVTGRVRDIGGIVVFAVAD